LERGGLRPPLFFPAQKEKTGLSSGFFFTGMQEQREKIRKKRKQLRKISVSWRAYFFMMELFSRPTTMATKQTSMQMPQTVLSEATVHIRTAHATARTAATIVTTIAVFLLIIHLPFLTAGPSYTIHN